MATHDQTPNPSAIILSQPKDIIYNIFFRLPVKTLLRLKSVCKSWLFLISSPEFIKTHLTVSTNDPHFTHHRIVSISGDWTHDFWTRSLPSLLDEPFTKILHNCDLYIDNVVGYCHGLILVKDLQHNYNKQLYLCNPSTKEVRKLPKLEWIFSLLNTVYGFCYDESDDDFKVFAISPAHAYDINDEIDEPTYYEYKVSVYSLRCDCWRIIGDFPFRLVAEVSWYPEFYDGVFANGSVHWLITPELKKKVILSLDIKSETYREVLQPNFGDGVYYLNLYTFDKSLFVLCQYENTRADFWIMKECGVEISWEKLFTIPYIDQLITRSSGLIPVCISSNSSVMLISGSNMVSYNLKDKKIKHLSADYHFAFPDVAAYVQSLISPHL